MKEVLSSWWFTRKKFSVEPPRWTPYAIFVWAAKSSAFSIGVCIRWTVRNAARVRRKLSLKRNLQQLFALPRLAVYDETRINVQNAQRQLTMRVDGAAGLISVPKKNNFMHALHRNYCSQLPWCMILHIKNQSALESVNWFSNSICVRRQTYGLRHSFGDNRAMRYKAKLTTMVRVDREGEKNRQRTEISSDDIQPNFET